MVTKDVQIQGSDYIESYLKTNYDDYYWECQFLDKITTYVSDLFNGPNWNIVYTTDARNIPTDTQDPYSWMENNDNYSGFEFMAIHNSETTDDVTGRGDEGGYSWVKFSDEDIDEMVDLGTSNGPGKPIGNASDSQPDDGQLFGIFHEICHMYGGEHESGLTNRNYYNQVNYRTPHGPSGDKYDSYSNCNGTHYLDSSLPDHPVVGVSDCWNPPSGVKIVTETELASMDFF